MPLCKTRWCDTRQRMSNWRHSVDPSCCRSYIWLGVLSMMLDEKCSLFKFQKHNWMRFFTKKQKLCNFVVLKLSEFSLFPTDFCHYIWKFTITSLVTSGISGHAHLVLWLSGRGQVAPLHHQATNDICMRYTQNIPSARQLCNNQYAGRWILP